MAKSLGHGHAVRLIAFGCSIMWHCFPSWSEVKLDAFMKAPAEEQLQLTDFFIFILFLISKMM